MYFRGISCIHRKIVKLGLEEENRELQQLLMENPRAGMLERGTCGLRKVRTRDGSRGQGKQFGARVHYLLAPHRQTIYMVGVYSKGEQDSLSPRQKIALCRWIRTTIVE